MRTTGRLSLLLSLAVLGLLVAVPAGVADK